MLKYLVVGVGGFLGAIARYVLGTYIGRRIFASNQEELARQLGEFDVKVRRGEKGGAGVLGRIAELVVSQRGITR